MQLVLSRLFEARKSSADGKISALKPMECMKPLRASRTDSSSSTMETTGVLELTSRIARPVLQSLNVLAEAQPAAVIQECRRDNSVTQECSRYQCLSCRIEEGTPALIHRLAELSHRSHPSNDVALPVSALRLDPSQEDPHHMAHKSR